MSTVQITNPDMTANNLTPAYPTHPGEILKDEIEFRGIHNVSWLNKWGLLIQS